MALLEATVVAAVVLVDFVVVVVPVVNVAVVMNLVFVALCVVTGHIMLSCG